MRAGELRHRVTVERSTETVDAMGEPDASWSAYVTRSASIEPLTGREALESQKVEARIDHMIKMRYTPGVVPKMRIVFGSRTFDIVSVANVEERNRELEILALERV